MKPRSNFGEGPTFSENPLLSSDSRFDSTLIDLNLTSYHRTSPWTGWRVRMVVVAWALGLAVVLMVANWLADTSHLAATWGVGPEGQVELASTSEASLLPYGGHPLTSISGNNLDVQLNDALVLQRSSRWVVSNIEREQHRELHARLNMAMADGKVTLNFAGNERAERFLQRRGIGAIGAMFWLFAALALALYGVAMSVVISKPSMRNLFYALMGLCQSGNLVFTAIESSLPLSLPMPIPALDLPARVAFDLITGAAMVHAVSLHPRKIPQARYITLFFWLVTMATVWFAIRNPPSELWWWVQGVVALMGLTSIGLLTRQYQLAPHPFAIVMRRFGVLTLVSWSLLSVMLAVVERQPAAQFQFVSVGPSIWYFYLASLLLLVPFLSKAQQVMRELTLLAAVSTIATALDLLFVNAFALGQFASAGMALFISLGIYSGARQWILRQLRSSNVLTSEQVFEKLYRIARKVQVHPERAAALLTQLLRGLFDPLEAMVIDKYSPSTRVTGDGSSLVVPVPELKTDPPIAYSAIVLRFAQRGHRHFTSEDARLTDRIIEQWSQAVAYDKAVEQGRSEERLRIAQDLHDDIGARLLTLMYKAQSPEMEDYLRHTLQDLKTLTRGLAAANHPLSHAAVEWRSDLSQRLSAAHIELVWNLSYDRDISLSVVQWSALTRMMRELVSNIIAHSNAGRVEVYIALKGDQFDIAISDNGIGRNPGAWAHGLGMGGVRKRVKQLSGEVEWRELDPIGILCKVCIRRLSEW